ncbi:MAG: pilus assembly FimT family protein [Candidatus Binatia bacterium]
MTGRYLARFSRGFTLIEILIGMAVLVILLGIITLRFGPLRGQADTNAASGHVLSALQLARNRTLASLGDTQHGVHFEPNQFVLFSGATYDPAASDNEVNEVPNGVEIYDISLGGGVDVIFDRVSGTTNNAGDISVRLIEDPSATRTISILPSGLVGKPGTVNTVDTRVADSRHLHFDLGWGIKNSTTLTLTFHDPPDADVVHTVPMADFFNADKSAFDWEGTVSVYGSGQALRIHTHILTDTETLLSIHRDRRFNDKALTIDIDGLDIVSYEDDGSASVGSSGGTMTQQ